MTTMTTTTPGVTGGVDTHGQTHHAAVLDHLGRQLGDREFPTTPSGYRSLLAWMAGHGRLERVGIEGTGTYGAALTRQLRAADVQVVEVDRPDRKARRAQGKSDPLDAYSAARSALAGTATGTPKARDGRVEAIRALRVARSSAVKARSQTTNQLKSLLITAPAELREQLRALSSGMRDQDLLGRFGGEEFVAMLVAADATETDLIAERLRQQVAELSVPTAAGPLVTVTVSIGVAAIDRSRSVAVADLLAAADVCMYRAKAAGRNQIVTG